MPAVVYLLCRFLNCLPSSLACPLILLPTPVPAEPNKRTIIALCELRAGLLLSAFDFLDDALGRVDTCVGLSTRARIQARLAEGFPHTEQHL
jgi:hypothetical protein